MGITGWLRRERFQSQSEEDGLIRQPFVLKIGQETVLPEIGKDIPLVVRASDGLKGIFTFRNDGMVHVQLLRYYRLRAPSKKKGEVVDDNEEGPMASLRFRFGLFRFLREGYESMVVAGCDVTSTVETRIMPDNAKKRVIPVEHTDLFFALHKAGGREVLRLYGPGWHLDYNGDVPIDPKILDGLSDLPR